MRNKEKITRKKFQARQRRVRTKISGTKEVPRLNVFRSLTNIYAQIIDDSIGHTLVSVYTKKMVLTGNKKEKAFAAGEALAKLASEKGIIKVVFDKSGYRYHGRVKALAEGARQGGLIF